MAHSKDIPPEPDPISATETAGRILSSARIGWDLTVEEVAENLNLGVSTIKALESDDYSSLPGYTFVKGYIRSYASILRLSPDEVIATVNLQPEKPSEIPASRGAIKLRGKSRIRKKKNKSRVFVKSFFFIILLVIISAVGLNQWSKLDTRKLAEIFKFPVLNNSEETHDSEIVFPPSSENSSTQNGGSKGALIRIEP